MKLLLPVKTQRKAQQNICQSVYVSTIKRTHKNPEQTHFYIRNGLIHNQIINHSYLQHYQLFNLLGRGQFGQTIRILNKQYAALKSTQFSHQSITEVTAQLLSSCAYVPRVYNAFSYNSSMYIEMELADGNLQWLVDCTDDREQLAWAVLHDISYAIQEVHSAGFYHLDCKTENILFKHLDDAASEKALEPSPGLVFPTSNDRPDYSEKTSARGEPQYRFRGDLCLGNVKFMLSDFGNATSQGLTYSELGDSRYLQSHFLQSHIPSQQCDYYSLGVTLFEICTNVELPVEGEAFALFKQRPFDMIEQWSYSNELREAILALMGGAEAVCVAQQYASHTGGRDRLGRAQCREERFLRVLGRKSPGECAIAARTTKMHCKDVQLTKDCLVADRRQRINESPCDYFTFDDSEEQREANARAPGQSELLATGLELSF